MAHGVGKCQPGRTKLNSIGQTPRRCLGLSLGKWRNIRHNLQGASGRPGPQPPVLLQQACSRCSADAALDAPSSACPEPAFTPLVPVAPCCLRLYDYANKAWRNSLLLAASHVVTPCFPLINGGYTRRVCNKRSRGSELPLSSQCPMLQAPGATAALPDCIRAPVCHQQVLFWWT